jgi:hypothetical protein
MISHFNKIHSTLTETFNFTSQKFNGTHFLEDE